jgi:hypothetical protein
MSNNPNLNFSVIISPPDSHNQASYPTSDYASTISKLNSNPQAHLLGYVQTSRATRHIKDVYADVDIYAKGWASCSGADIYMDGIFFDKTPNAFSSTSYEYMSNVTSYARSHIPSARVIFNPGVVPDLMYFQLADYVNVFEDSYLAYSSQTLGTIPTPIRAKSTVMIRDFTGSPSVQRRIVSNFMAGGISGLSIVSQSANSSWKTLWAKFATAMEL